MKMTNNTMTAIILFAKNEDKIIGRVIDDLQCVLQKIPNLKPKLFLCNDSVDRTAEIAKQRGVKIIHGSGKGLGWSYYLALYSLTNPCRESTKNQNKAERNFNSIITIDGDGQTDLSELPRFYREFKKGYDLVVGSRFVKKDSISYDYSTINFLGVKALSFVLTCSTLQKFTDSHGGLRIMNASVAKEVHFLGGHSYVQETIIDAAAKGFKIKEIPAKWNRRLYGESRVVRSKLKYIKNMAWPLLIRMRIHWLGILASLILFIFLQKILYVFLAGFCIFIEFYKLWTFKKNKRKIKKMTLSDGVEF